MEAFFHLLAPDGEVEAKYYLLLGIVFVFAIWRLVR
jgi:hypothetical protein